MNLKDLSKMWVRYQTWLKEQGITKDNIKEKMPEIIAELKKDPSKIQQIQSFLNSSQGKNIAHQLNISDEQLGEMNNTITSVTPVVTPSFSSRLGNLSQEQLDMIKRFKSGKPL